MSFLTLPWHVGSGGNCFLSQSLTIYYSKHSYSMLPIPKCRWGRLSWPVGEAVTFSACEDFVSGTVETKSDLGICLGFRSNCSLSLLLSCWSLSCRSESPTAPKALLSWAAALSTCCGSTSGFKSASLAPKIWPVKQLKMAPLTQDQI